jgi:hypothetical protein
MLINKIVNVLAPQEPKPDRWVELASPYINYPTATALNM